MVLNPPKLEVAGAGVVLKPPNPPVAGAAAGVALNPPNPPVEGAAVAGAVAPKPKPPKKKRNSQKVENVEKVLEILI